MFFFLLPLLPALPILCVYIAAALLPAVLLLRYIYRHDTVEKEPAPLLASLLLMGVLAAVCSGVLEGIGQSVLQLLVAPTRPIYTVLMAFLVVAAVEEGTKFFFLKRRTWNHPAFNYRFDGVVYAVFVSLGFAAIENVEYVFSYGLSVALPRALLSVPGHMAFSVFMGAFYGRARLYADLGDDGACRRCLWGGYLTAVLLHGFYDTCAMMGGGLSLLVFGVFVAMTFFAAYRTVKRESATDAPV